MEGRRGKVRDGLVIMVRCLKRRRYVCIFIETCRTKENWGNIKFQVDI
jgi:hypothetical protein